MTVGEAIKKLQEFDPELPLWVVSYDPVEEVVEVKFDNGENIYWSKFPKVVIYGP